ncbi:hypothetical protein [Burkholderia sp. Bp8998]|uniref:hypothetical protein n=1 Tax=Burkholderia sp. Bp8998 TaxID=2184557 RepID=UPI0021AB31DD|nr:hypothetical protein [Burkholderia sp. Bp8998]
MTQVNRARGSGNTVGSSTREGATARGMQHARRATAGWAPGAVMSLDCGRNSRPDEAFTMKRRALMVGVLLVLGACAGAERAGTFRTTETRLLAMRQAASLQCATPSECDRAWSRTRRYVEAHSSTRITRASADRIETAQPHLAGDVYLWASRAASGDGGAVIRLKAMCKGMYDSNGGPGWQYDACARKILEIGNGFQSYENPPDAVPNR